MPNTQSTALLPAGLHDVLPNDAALEAAAVERLMGEFASHGYQRVSPPLMEFEGNLLSGPGASMAAQTFRLMDPLSQRMMALRADITPQMARIAASRLHAAPRPLRLCYAGPVLRVKGSQLRPERQLMQAGVELIGSLQPAADAEAVLLAARALDVVGVRHVSVDLCVPTMVPLVCRGLGLDEDTAARLRAALDRKDAAAVAAEGGPAAALLGRMMDASGPAERAMAALASFDLPDAAEKDRRRMTEVVGLIRAAAPSLTLTIDLVEHRGFEYQTGLSFTLFARGQRGEMGSGGRYRAGTHGKGPDADGEPATGFTLYLDSVLRAVPPLPEVRRVYVPHTVPHADATALRAAGWVTLAGLEPVAEPEAEARRLGCTHLFHGGAVVPLA